MNRRVKENESHGKQGYRGVYKFLDSRSGRYGSLSIFLGQQPALLIYIASLCSIYVDYLSTCLRYRRIISTNVPVVYLIYGISRSRESRRAPKSQRRYLRDRNLNRVIAMIAIVKTAVKHKPLLLG